MGVLDMALSACKALKEIEEVGDLLIMKKHQRFLSLS